MQNNCLTENKIINQELIEIIENNEHNNNNNSNNSNNNYNIQQNTNEIQKLFLPQEIQKIKLNKLRQKRKEIQNKLKMVANRMNFKKKKQQEQLKRYIRTQQRSRIISETKNYRHFNSVMKDQMAQRKIFQGKKKAKEVEDFRITNNRRLSLIYRSVRDRKISESDKLRQAKKIEQQNIIFDRLQAIRDRRQKHQIITRMKQRQNNKRKYYWIQKKLGFQQKIIQQTQMYQKHIQNCYKKINNLKLEQQQLKSKQSYAQQVLKCAQHNYQLLKDS